MTATKQPNPPPPGMKESSENAFASTRAIVLALVLVTLLAYLPVARHDFLVIDDPDYISSNNMVYSGLTAAGIKWAFTTFHASNWHPLTWLSLMLGCELFGLDASAHHLMNAIVHCANTALLFLFLFRTTSRRWPAAVVAALFALHPMHVESVAWVAERKDVLSASFFLLALLSYWKFVELKNQSSQMHGGTRSPAGVKHPQKPLACPTHAPRYYALTLLLFALGLMSKPMLVTLPFVLLLLDFWPLNRWWNAGRRAEKKDLPSRITRPAARLTSLIAEKLPFFLLSAASCIVTLRAQRSAIASLEVHPFALRASNAVIAYARYPLKLLWPAHLSAVYAPPEYRPWWQVAGAAALLLALSVWAWTGRQRRPWCLMGWLWFLGTLVPVIGLVQAGSQSIADRYTYLPAIGLFIAVVYGINDFLPRFSILSSRLSFAGTALILLGCLVITERQLRYWKNSERLFNHAIALDPYNGLSHMDLGAALEAEGRRYDGLRQYRQALHLAETHPHLADTRATPAKRAMAYAKLASEFEQAGYTNEAIAEYREALQRDSSPATIHQQLGWLLARLGQFEAATTELSLAARLQPNDSRPLFLIGKTCLLRGQNEEGVVRLKEAVRLNQNDVPTLIFLARVLAALDDPMVRNGAEALTLARKANSLTGARDPYVLDTLAMACAEADRFDEAQQTARRAIALATAASLDQAILQMQQRLALYQSNQPYRESFRLEQPHSPR